MAREYCYRCFKSARLCVCDIEPVANRTRVWIVQHPAERQHPINTARLTALGLTRASINVAWNAVLEAPSDLVPGAAVLFPSEDSRDLVELAPTERPRGLVLLDGTWSQARKLYLRNPWLRALPHVHLRPEAPSRYRIRRQPREGYLSTLEATVAALRILEPDNRDLDRLLERFDEMIETQARFVENPPPGAYRHMRAELPGRPPRAPESTDAEGLVLCYGDFLAGVGADQPVVLCAERVRTAERLTLVFRGDAHHPADVHLEHMGLPRAEYDSAPLWHEAGARLRAFLREDDVLGAWNAVNSRKLLALAQLDLPTCSLKADYCNWSKTTCGHLDDVVQDLRRVDSRVRTPERSLRADRRLEQALEVYRWMCRDVAAVLRTYDVRHATRESS